MPLTGSHPAAVLPLLRTPLPASALVDGSIAPDVPSLPVELLRPTRTALAVVGLAGGPSATTGAPDLNSAAVAAAFHGGGAALEAPVVPALAVVRPARVTRGTGADRRRPG